jgi:hypothetical protein
MPLTTLNRLLRITNAVAPYGPRLLKTRPEALIAYWPLNDTSGTLCHDAGPHGFHGTYLTAPICGPGIGDDLPAVRFGNGFYMACPAALASLTPNEGSFSCWARVENLAVWADGATRNLFYMAGSSSKYLSLSKRNPNKLRAERYITAAKYSEGTQGSSAWLHLVMLWSTSSGLKLFVNGVQSGSTATALPPWSGAPTGFYLSYTSNQWLGQLAHAALWSAVLTQDEITKLARYTP